MNDEQIKSLILSEGATLRDAMLSFDATALQVVLVCNPQGHLIGLATEGDVRRALLEGQGLASPLAPSINRKPVTGRAGMPREELVGLLSERVHCLPVLDANSTVADILFSDRRTKIPIATPAVGERELRYVTDAVLSGWISSQGKYIGRFEEQFAAFCGVPHAVSVSNGTVALHLALTALGVGPGDEVIVPALTFVATASVVRHCHATPVFVDVCPGNWTIDAERISEAVTPRTKAILPVHLYGQPCDMDRIMRIASKHNLCVIEDAAEAHGATWRGRRVGSIGQVGCFSFFGNKIITTGEGGMVVTNDSQLNDKMRILRDHGMSKTRKYWHDVVGFNYRMTNLQAAIGVAQLERWDQIIEAKNRICIWYQEGLDPALFDLPKSERGAVPVCWLFTVLLKQSCNAEQRDQIIDELGKLGVDCRPAFYCLPAMPPYFEEGWMQRYPNSTNISQRGVSLPSSVELSKEVVSRVIEAVNQKVGRSRNHGTKHVSA